MSRLYAMCTEPTLFGEACLMSVGVAFDPTIGAED